VPDLSASEPTPERSDGDVPSAAAARKLLRPLNLGLGRLAAGAKRERPASPPLSRRDIVNGLDRRESIIGIGLTLLAIVLAVVGYHEYKTAATALLRSQASFFLIASLIGAALLALGTALRRRALLGFACFMTGLEFLNYKSIGAVVYISAGSWLIFRVMQKKKQDTASGVATKSVTTRPDRRPTPVGPKPSKRYTPPKRAAAGRRR